MINNDISHRCGRTAKHGGSCMTPVAVEGGVCGNHRPAVQNYDSRKTAKRAQDHVSAFIENYQCPGCDANVDLFTADPAQLILIGHDSDCPQLVEHVQRRSAA
jgi:hypothetical protein